MGVLVKGMQMPNDCSECEFHFTTSFAVSGVRTDGCAEVIVQHWCRHLTQQVMTGGTLGQRHPSCPLTYVPESKGGQICQ